MAIDGEQVFPAIVIVVDKLCAPGQKRVSDLGDTHFRADLPVISGAFVAVERLVIVGERPRIEVDQAVVAVIAYRQPHRGRLPSILIQRKTGEHADIFKSPVSLIDIEIVWGRIVGDEQVYPPVVIHIDECRREAVGDVFVGHAGFLTDVRERTISVVMKKMIGLALQASRSAHYAFTAELAKAIPGGWRKMIHIPVDVSRNEEIQPAISVVVAEAGASRPVAQSNSRLFRHVGKRAIVVVVIKTVLSEIRDID